MLCIKRTTLCTIANVDLESTWVCFYWAQEVRLCHFCKKKKKRTANPDTSHTWPALPFSFSTGFPLAFFLVAEFSQWVFCTAKTKFTPICTNCWHPPGTEMCFLQASSSSNPHERLSIWLVSRYTGTLSVQMNSPLVQFTSLTFRMLLLTKNNNKILLLHIPLHPGCVGFKACQETVSLF